MISKVSPIGQNWQRLLVKNRCETRHNKQLFILLSLVFVLITAPMSSIADGKFYYRENIPSDIPFQRAILLFEDGIETLIVQSKYQSTLEDFGWVIPIPAYPELAIVKPHAADMLFRNLATRTRPDITTGTEIIALLALITLILPIILRILISIYAFLRKRKDIIEYKKPDRKKEFYTLLVLLILGGLIFVNSDIFGLLFILYILVLFFIFLFRAKLIEYFVVIILAAILTPSYQDYSVRVLSEFEIGPYDVAIIQASDSIEIIKWLNESGFKYNEQDTDVFESYIERDWYFVTARLDRERRTWQEDGMVSPLVLRFSTSSPVYPLALTGTTGGRTQIILYVLAHNKMLANSSLGLVYADKYKPILEFSGEDQLKTIETEPENFLSNSESNFTYMSKYRGILEPADMKNDLVFTSATDDMPYRPKIYRWGDNDALKLPTGEWVFDFDADAKGKDRL